VVIILAVSIAALAHFDFKADVKQFTLEGADVGKSLQAIVFAIFSFVGFESAASLGKEARNPERVIPKAIIWTAISAGVFFVFTTYVITQGFADDATKLGASGAPLGDILAGQNPLIIALVYFGAAISSFACALASINAFGRTLFSLGRYQILHSSVGLVHTKFKTPHIAVTVGAIINFAAVALLSGNAEVDTFGWYGTIASFGFIVVYFLVSVAAPAYLKKTGELTTGAATIGALGAALMVLALAGSLYPVPAFPYNLLPYGFLAYLLLGIVWFYVLKSRAPEALLGIENDMEAAAAQAVSTTAEPAPAE
jgi:amino acid transporter